MSYTKTTRVMPAIFWTRYFVAEKGYNVKYNLLHKYNKSSNISEKNENSPISKSTMPINIWYFFINYRVKNSEVSVLWFPTGDMIGDYMT